MKEQITLCSRCASDYRDAGYKLYIIKTITVKDECFICRRMGWTFIKTTKAGVNIGRRAGAGFSFHVLPPERRS